MQSLVLGLDAYLALERMPSIGSLFAATLLFGRALQPVEQVVGLRLQAEVRRPGGCGRCHRAG